MSLCWLDWARTPAALLAILAASLLTAWLIVEAGRVKALEMDLAEIRDVRYGLLDADNWVAQITAILDRRIEGFELTDENRPVIKRNVERLLDRLIVEVQTLQQRQNRAGGSWLERLEGALRQGVQDLVIDFDDLRAKVPYYAERVLEELSTPEAKADLRAQLKAAVAGLAADTFARTDRRPLEAALARQGCSKAASCGEQLQAQIGRAKAGLVARAGAVVALVALLFALILARRDALDGLAMLLLTLATLVLLAGGVLIPMISIEAGIAELRLQLLGEPLVFRDQILYFQSKSVIDVVRVLAETGEADLLLVAGLIGLFSVVFPAAKVAASYAYYRDWRGWRGCGLVRFFALKSGKWSMADVMVVAMFMAFVGFRGLVASQLGSLGGAGPSLDVLTTNGTGLEIGFYLFLAFCLASLALSSALDVRFGERHPT